MLAPLHWRKFSGFTRMSAHALPNAVVGSVFSLNRWSPVNSRKLKGALYPPNLGDEGPALWALTGQLKADSTPSTMTQQGQPAPRSRDDRTRFGLVACNRTIWNFRSLLILPPRIVLTFGHPADLPTDGRGQ